MDLYGKDKGNVSLPLSLQPPDFGVETLKDVIINTQKCFYDLKIAEVNKRIQRLEERNKELADSLKNTDFSIKDLQAETAQEISTLSSQITSQAGRVQEYKKQLTALEKSRIDNESAHAAKIMNINEKYNNTRLKLISQLKILSAKTNVLEDYKSMQQILEKKLDAQNRALIYEKEEVAENLRRIERKSKMDREKLKKELYNRLLDFSGVFQLDVGQHIPRSMSKLLSENITVNNMLSTINEEVILKRQDCIKNKNVIKEYQRKIDDAHLSAKQSLVVEKLEKSMIAMLRVIRNKADANLSRQEKHDYLKEEQYIINKDNAKNKARKCETRAKKLEILLYCEKEKLDIAKYQKQWISEQLQTYSQMLYDVQCVLKNLKIEQGKVYSCKEEQNKI